MKNINFRSEGPVWWQSYAATTPWPSRGVWPIARPCGWLAPRETELAVERSHVPARWRWVAGRAPDPEWEHTVARLGSGLTQPPSLTGDFSYPFLFILHSPFGYLFPFLSLFSLVFALKAQPRKGRPCSITLPPTFSCYLHQRPQAHTFETECHVKDYQLKKKDYQLFKEETSHGKSDFHSGSAWSHLPRRK